MQTRFIIPGLALLCLLIQQPSAHSFDTVSISDDPASRAVTPLELLSNDKEEKSILVSHHDLKDAEKELGSIAEHTPALKHCAEALSEYLYGNDGAVCENNALKLLQSSAAESQLPADARGLKAILIGMRSLDLIDDVILLPLLKSIPVFNEMSAPGCASDRYLAAFANLKSTELKSFKRDHFKDQLRTLTSENHTEADLPLFEKLYEIKWDRIPYSLSHAVENIRAIKDRSLPSAAPSVKSVFASKKKKKSGGLSYRMYLHAQYNSSQIRYLSNIFYRFNYKVWNADHSQLVHYDRNNTVIESVDLTPEEKYNVFVRQLHKEIGNDTKLTEIFDGKDVTFDDVAMAGLESGTVEGQMANKILEIEDFWDPKTSKWTKFLNVFQKYGSASFILMPPPFNTLASVTILFLQTFVVKDHSKDPTPDQLGETLW